MATESMVMVPLSAVFLARKIRQVFGSLQVPPVESGPALALAYLSEPVPAPVLACPFE